jgi:hypothetical protein
MDFSVSPFRFIGFTSHIFLVLLFCAYVSYLSCL